MKLKNKSNGLITEICKAFGGKLKGINAIDE